jgi:hypothetical protein
MTKRLLYLACDGDALRGVIPVRPRRRSASMTRPTWLLLAAVVAGGCGGTAPPPAPAAPAPRSYANLAQLMRGIPFPNSNIVFDTQTTDPGAAREGDARGSGATADFSHVYGGWQAVENSALSVAETATLIMVPGRTCENGRPAPVEREDYRQFANQLADAGLAAYKAAQSRSLDAMVEVSGTVADACAACHEVYRDKEDPKDRCIP